MSLIRLNIMNKKCKTKGFHWPFKISWRKWNSPGKATCGKINIQVFDTWNVCFSPVFFFQRLKYTFIAATSDGSKFNMHQRTYNMYHIMNRATRKGSKYISIRVPILLYANIMWFSNGGKKLVRNVGVTVYNKKLNLKKN